MVTINSEGNFGDVTITAQGEGTDAPSSSVVLKVTEGLVRELFDYSDYCSWGKASNQNSTLTWNNTGDVTMTTYLANEAERKYRGDLVCQNTAWLHAGNYPYFAIRMTHPNDTEGWSNTMIKFDASNGKIESDASVTYSGELGSGNNKYVCNYLCSDNSRVFVYNLSTQAWGKNGLLMPLTEKVKYTTFQFKIADIVAAETATVPVTYNVYWIQSFQSLTDVKAYITSEGLSITKADKEE
ncbi:MAG: DUF4979 domain-containing protein [Bacteroides sp.]|nr:DUF4979 domain-containing protein [Bacteroides sp.]